MRGQPRSESANILVSKDRASRLVSAHVVPMNGAVIERVVQQCARDLKVSSVQFGSVGFA